ncbi:MAG: hypothetical protein BAJALOKI1v1_510006 [Promethearchaeota archaeon]|nr:MAG: hypothetical protein BAJALOKI1v1_510006 [Candidatus Lokiarchaeota archaeon]
MNYNQIKAILENFIERVHLDEQNAKITVINHPSLEGFDWIKTGVSLDNYKDIVLTSETGLELGGMNKTSFSLIYPLKITDPMNASDKITIIGPEINEINTSHLHFGLFILLRVNHLSDEIYESLRTLSFISNGIEGFSIRTIPRRFWCKISEENIKKNFSFQFLAYAIMALYREKFGKDIAAIEIFMISESSKLITMFLNHTAAISEELKNRWKMKVDNWKKRIDCEYEWGCEICPYFTSCKNLQDILEERKNLEL